MGSFSHFCVVLVLFSLKLVSSCLDEVFKLSKKRDPKKANMSSELHFHIFLLLFSFKLVSACLNGQCREMAFPAFFFFADKRLVNHNITTVQVQDMGACELLCYHEPNCVSFNFENKASAEGKYSCDLNNSTHKEHDEDFLETKGYFYHGAENSCVHASCQNGGTCQSGFTSKRYRCLCPSGFTSEHCEKDINECRTKTHKCDKNAKCKNNKGSYTCICKTGYSGDGVMCQDIDECVENTHNCSKNNAVCNNTEGSFNCTCLSGYTGDGHNCTDIDECIDNTHNCSKDNAVCNNTEGSFSCTCKPGYTGDGHNCTVVNVCSEKQPCKNGGECENKDEGYICRCEAGFTGTNCEHKCTIDSKIIKGENFLRHFFRFLAPAVGNDCQWVLCYRASDHGWSAWSFHNRCDGKKNTVTTIKNHGYVFGGYTDIPWDTSNNHGSTSNAFVFSLRNKKGLDPFKSMVKIPSRAIFKSSAAGPTFGVDIKIVNDANDNMDSVARLGYSYPVPSGVNAQTMDLAHSYYFTPNEVEVFYLA